VRPFYALADAGLFAPPGALDPAPTAWADLKGKKICTLGTNYVEPPLSAAGIVPVQVGSSAAMAAGVAAGDCVGAVADGLNRDLLAAGLVRSDLGTLVPAPYAVAVSKDATADDLAMRVSGALVELMTGPTPALIKAEAEAYAEYGAAPEPALASLSRALNTMEACPATPGTAPAKAAAAEQVASAAPARGALAAAAAAAVAVAAALF
jgi:hypothetical protein